MNEQISNSKDLEKVVKEMDAGKGSTQNFNLDKFDTLKTEVSELVENCKKVVASIKDTKNVTGYNLMKENKGLLVKKRGEVVGILKGERSFAMQYQKSVVKFEKELLEIMSPLEIELGGKIKEADAAKMLEIRKALLPDRHIKLKIIDLVVTDEELIKLDEVGFDEFYNEMHAEFLAEKERKIKETEEKAKRDKEIKDAEDKAAEDARQKTLADAETARIKAQQDKEKELETERNKVKQANIDKDKEIEEERNKEATLKKNNRIERIISLGLVFNGQDFVKDDFNINHLDLLLKDEEFEAMFNKVSNEVKRREIKAEKQVLIDEQKKKDEERERLEKEKKEKEDEKVRLEEEEKEKFDKQKKYQKFLKNNGYTEATKYNFFIKRVGLVDGTTKVVLYKEVAEFMQE